MLKKCASRKRADNRVQEFVWAFGSEAEQEMEKADCPPDCASDIG